MKMEWKAKAHKTNARLQPEMTMKFVIVAAEQDQEHGLGQRSQKQLEQKHSTNPRHPFG